MEFPAVNRRRVEASFDGGEVSSNGGVLLLREVERRVGLLSAVAKRIQDPRSPLLIKHSLASLLKQRVYGLCLGYEDLNDHHQLRKDTLVQTAAERGEVLGSSSTLCRLENWGHHRASSVAIHEVIVERFIASYAQAPKELILDFDATNDPVHGEQEGRFFHGFYDQYCFLPLYVFCGEQLLVSYLRPSKIDAAQHSWAILSLLVKRLRQAWPDVKIILRGGFRILPAPDAQVVRAPWRALHCGPGEERRTECADCLPGALDGRHPGERWWCRTGLHGPGVLGEDLEADTPRYSEGGTRTGGCQPPVHRHQPGR